MNEQQELIPMETGEQLKQQTEDIGNDLLNTNDADTAGANTAPATDDAKSTAINPPVKSAE